MVNINSINHFIRRLVRQIRKTNPFKIIGKRFIDNLNLNELNNPIFTLHNERPIEYRFVFDNIIRYGPKKVLDVGTGVTALPHLIYNCGTRVLAIDNINDYWPEGMQNRHYHVLNDDITNSKLTDRFDMITCVSVLEHIDEFDKAISSMAKLLTPDGVIVLTFPYTESRFIDNVYSLPDSCVKLLPAYKTHSFSRAEIDHWINKNNLKIQKQEYWKFYSGEFWTIGDRYRIPKEVDVMESHNLTCIAMTVGG